MAAEFTPVKVKRGDDEREATSPAQLAQLQWDGFLTSEQEADLTPAEELTAGQKAARTRAAKKAQEKSSDTSSSASLVGAASSGDTAEGEKTVGTNPS